MQLLTVLASHAPFSALGFDNGDCARLCVVGVFWESVVPTSEISQIDNGTSWVRRQNFDVGWNQLTLGERLQIWNFWFHKQFFILDQIPFLCWVLFGWLHSPFSVSLKLNSFFVCHRESENHTIAQLSLSEFVNLSKLRWKDCVMIWLKHIITLQLQWFISYKAKHTKPET